MNLQTVVFIGRSGSGKGVQAEMFMKYLKEKTPDVPQLYVETGTYFRKYTKESGYTWDNARKTMDLGKRQPDFLAVWMWATAFIENYTGKEHVIFDGAPRAIEEAHILETTFPFYERENPTVVFINASEKWVEERLSGRGRADDVSPEVVARRLAFFEKDVVPVIEYYRSRSPNCKLVEVSGEQTPDEVHRDVLKALGLE